MDDHELAIDPLATSTAGTASDLPSQLLLLVVGDGVYATEPLIPSGRIVLGRADDSDVVIDDRTISRFHAALHLDPPLRIEDLGSANGTWIHEQRLEPNQPREIRINEPMRLGNVTIIIQRRPTKLRTRRIRNHAYFEDRVEDECVRAARNHGHFALVHVVLDDEVAELQHQVASLLRAGDVVASYAPNELEILLIDTNPTQAARALERLDELLAAGHVKARIGWVSYPRDGREPGSLAECARERAHGTSASLEPESKIVVADARMTSLYELVDRIAASDITVLLLGETGVGKEIVAETIHRCSARANKPLVRLNCAALTESLLESELFGHERGAFTGAIQTKLGLFEVADGGVVFLDEVGEMPLSTQAKLLRVLDERKVTRVGSVKPFDIDVRLVAATNRDLDAEVRRGQFRLDLLYRLNAMSVVVPPLRERIAEIAPLARSFLRTFSGKIERPTLRLAPAALALLESYSWPGNVRELRNVIERAVILASGDEIQICDLPADRMRTTFTASEQAPRAAAANVVAPPVAAGTNVDERQRIIAALEASAGNQTSAAKLLGVSRRTLITWIEKFDVPRPRKR